MIKVRVPATSANMGPGFDVLGIALSQYSYYECELNDDIVVDVEGLECEKINTDDNIVLDSMNKVFEKAGKSPKGYKLKIINGIPLARGLGSSASAIVGGLMVGNALIDNALSEQELLELATELEGHPDNVAPALFGNIVLSAVTDEKEILYKKVVPFSGLTTVTFSPDYEVSTKEARGVMPKSITVSEAVKTSSNLSLMMFGFLDGDVNLISKTMNDVLHEPYRKNLIKNYEDFKSEALSKGAFSFSISGSGSTIIAYCLEDKAQEVCEAMDNLRKKLNISGKVSILKPDLEGAKYINGGK